MGFIGTRAQFIEKYGNFIHEICEGTGLLPGTMAAQAIIESASKYNGKWQVGGSKLSRDANNFFGIKCHSWKGNKYYIGTPEYDKNGKKYFDQNACFRKYNSVEDSIKDHLKFLQVNKRYQNAGVFNAKTVKDQAIALKKGGYATAPNYANTILSVYNDIAPLLEATKKKPNKQLTKYLPILLILIGGYVYLNKQK
jgi:flagellum-specific peptidoglycan hydrolase FlgJ